MRVPVRTEVITQVDGDGEWLGSIQFGSCQRPPPEIFRTRPTAARPQSAR